MGIHSFLSRKKKSKSSPTPTPTPPLTETPSDSRSSSVTSKTHTEELEQVFRKFDVNGDGKVSWSELGSIMGSLGHPLAEDELKKMIKEADSDGDGFIDLDEFIELNTKGVDYSKIMEDLKNAFLIFDVDGNGSISPEELQKVLRSLGDESSIADCKKMISGVDANGDGLISFEEFKTMMMGSRGLNSLICRE